MQTCRAKLKAKGAQDPAFLKSAGEVQAICEALDKFIEKGNDSVAVNELLGPDEADDKIYVGKSAELEALCAASEVHTDGAKRAKTRFTSLVSG